MHEDGGVSVMRNRCVTLSILIVPTQIASMLLITILWNVYSTELYIVPPETGASATYGVLFSLIPITLSFVFARLLKIKGFRALVTLLQSLVVGVSVYVILLPFIGNLSWIASTLALMASIWVLARGNSRSKTAFVGVFSISASILLALSFPLVAILVFSTMLAIFDLYAVFKGPLSKGLPFALVAQVGSMMIGVGDMIFYALIPSSLYLHKGVLTGLIALILVNLGAMISAKLLEKRETIPGLPIPLLLTLPLFII